MSGGNYWERCTYRWVFGGNIWLLWLLFKWNLHAKQKFWTQIFFTVLGSTESSWGWRSWWGFTRSECEPRHHIDSWLFTRIKGPYIALVLSREGKSNVYRSGISCRYLYELFPDNLHCSYTIGFRDSSSLLFESLKIIMSDSYCGIEQRVIWYCFFLYISIFYFWHNQCQYQALLIDEFVTGIKEYTSSVSESTSPASIVLFSVSW